MFLLCRLTRAAYTCAPSFTVLRNRRLYEAFLTNDVEGKQPRPTPPLSKTPPYVTAKPEVTALPIAGADAAEGELRFVVLATDGRASRPTPRHLPCPASFVTDLTSRPAHALTVFDRLSNEAVVGLVGTFLASPDLCGAVPKADVLSRVLAPEAGAEGFDGKKETVKARKDDAAAEGGFIFGQDTNAATLLVRNSLGKFSLCRERERSAARALTLSGQGVALPD
jgi:pyruvate dehydrogenase phosphatase